MRVGSFDSGQQAAISWITSTLTGHALATIVEHLSNQNSQRNIFHSECHRGVGVGLYHSYWQEAFGVSWLLAAKPLPSNQTEYPSKPFCKTYISASEHRIEMGVGLYIHTDFGASWLAAAKPLPSNQTEYPSNPFCKEPISPASRTSYRDGGWLVWLIASKQELLHATHASKWIATC